MNGIMRRVRRVRKAHREPNKARVKNANDKVKVIVFSNREEHKEEGS